MKFWFAKGNYRLKIKVIVTDLFTAFPIVSEQSEEYDSWEDLSNVRTDFDRLHGYRLTSPINLQSRDAVFNPDLYRRPLEVYYAETRDVILENIGSTVRLLLSSPPSG